VDLLAGGVPYPSFTIAGNKLGATYERDLFAWAIELGGTVQPRALMLRTSAACRCSVRRLSPTRA
jgi:DNA (cytosine-5)-methyltransferase 1